jgi:hypothetical protein
LAVWSVDLTTEDGALSAVQNGGMACFIAAGLSVLGIVVLCATHGISPVLFASLAGAAIELAIFVVAGLRFRAGKGMVWGSVAALLIVLEIITKLVTLTGAFGIVINAALLVATINGVRGARALRRIDLSPADAAEIFN